MFSSSSGVMAGKVGEVETEALRGHQRAGLLDVLPQLPLQDGLEDVGGGVVAGDGSPPVAVHREVGRGADA